MFESELELSVLNNNEATTASKLELVDSTAYNQDLHLWMIVNGLLGFQKVTEECLSAE